MENFEFKLNNETFQKLPEGKKLILIQNDIKISIIPPNNGILLTI